MFSFIINPWCVIVLFKLYTETTCFMPNFIPKMTHIAGTSFAQISHEMDDIKRIITFIGESDTTDQLFCEAETSHGPTWLVGRHVKPAKKKKKYYCIWRLLFAVVEIRDSSD